MFGVSEQNVRVWGATVAVWGAFYAGFVAAFGSADGSVAGPDYQSKSSGSETSEKTRSKSQLARESREEERKRAAEFAAEALSPVSQKKNSGKRSESPAPSPAAATKKAERTKSKSPSRASKKFEVGAQVEVSEHTQVGSRPRPGGVGVITGIGERGSTYDVAYALGGKEAGIASKYITAVDITATERKRKPRPSEKKAAADDQAESGKRTRRR